MLGAILLDNAALDTAAERLSARDFFLDQHGRIFVQMLTLQELQQAIDLVTLTEALHRRGELEAAGGTAYISTLADGMPRVSNVEHYARIVKEKAVLRDLIHATEAIQHDAFNGHEASTILADAEAKLTQLRESGKPSRNLFDSFEDFENASPISFSIRGFLQKEAITAIAGLSGHGKTWIALSIARALLFGPGQLWDWFEVPERAERVVYLIPESSRGPIKERLKITGLYDEVRSERLLVRTLNMGNAPNLSDTALLRAAQRSTVILDTGVRFMKVSDEANAIEVAEGLSNDMLGLLRADASSVVPLFHSPKGFLKESAMSLEGMIRGSSELGAVLATAWGIRQLDRESNIIHIQNLKPRDFQPCGPFQIVGRPYLDKDGDFAMLKKPDECGSLADEQPELNRGGGAPEAKREAKAANLALLKAWLAADPNLGTQDLRQRFKTEHIDVSDSTIRSYKHILRRQT